MALFARIVPNTIKATVIFTAAAIVVAMLAGGSARDIMARITTDLPPILTLAAAFALAINLAAALAEYGRRVLVVDFDPQGAASVGLGVPPHELDRTVYNLIMDRAVDYTEVLRTTAVPGLDLLPANIDLSAAEVQLVTEVARESALSRALRPALDEYDEIIVDCQPSLGLLTVNALTAAHGVLIPLECEFFALRGVALLVETIEKVRDRLNPRLQVDGILATMYDSRTLHAREVVARVHEAFGDKLFQTVIARTVKFPDATVAAEPITTYAPAHTGAEAYRRDDGFGVVPLALLGP